MKDRFKFRAWDKTYKRFYYFEFSKDGKRDTINPNEPFGEIEEWQQSTSLKDKNGKLIYEGDVVKSISKEPVYGVGTKTGEQLHEVIYEESLGGYLPFVEGFEPSVYCEFEIIGNIYENPEPLTQAQTERNPE